MNAFTLKLGNTTYECSGNQSTAKDQNWSIQATMDGIRVAITIPIESKLTRLQCMAFVERLHEGLSQARQDQKPVVEYTS